MILFLVDMQADYVLQYGSQSNPAPKVCHRCYGHSPAKKVELLEDAGAEGLIRLTRPMAKG